MLDHDELRKYFNKQQQQDMIDLDIICMQTPPGRVRRARVRKIKTDHIPRPVNSFMSYRTEKQLIIRKFCPNANHRDISKMVAKWWHNAGHAEKAIFIDRAKIAKEVHTEKYPDYIFRPKTKRSKKEVSSPTAGAARTRPIAKVVKSHVLPSPTTSEAFPHNNNYTVKHENDYNTTKHVNSHNMTTHESNYNNVTNENNNYNTVKYDGTYNYNYSGNNISNMYNDEVLFNEDEANSSNFWDNSYNSSAQVMANSYPCITPQPQNSYYGLPLQYYPSPLPSTLSHEPVNNVINPIATTMSPQQLGYSSYSTNSNNSSTSFSTSNNSNTSGGGYVNADGQLYSGFNSEVTPYSQAMSTPMLDYTSSPINNSKISPFMNSQEEKFVDYKLFNNTCMFENSTLPTDVLSSSINDNFASSSWSNNNDIKHDNTSLLGDCDYWGNDTVH